MFFKVFPVNSRYINKVYEKFRTFGIAILAYIISLINFFGIRGPGMKTLISGNY